MRAKDDAKQEELQATTNGLNGQQIMVEQRETLMEEIRTTVLSLDNPALALMSHITEEKHGPRRNPAGPIYYLS